MFQTCRPKTVGTLCRDSKQECDLAEYCTGHSEYCPEDVFKMDGSKCNRGKVNSFSFVSSVKVDLCYDYEI